VVSKLLVICGATLLKTLNASSSRFDFGFHAILSTLYAFMSLVRSYSPTGKARISHQASKEQMMNLLSIGNNALVAGENIS